MNETRVMDKKMESSSTRLYEHARSLIPGGTQLLSKRPEMFLPGEWPAYYSKAEGFRVWDLDGREYADFSYNGIGACTLGFADPDVTRAVVGAVEAGSMATLNCPEEVELAETLCSIHPWAEQVRYFRTGGEAMVGAVRIARAASGKDLVLFCGYHGWHDWYLAANLHDDEALDGHLLSGLEPAGVPRGLRGTALPFAYNDLEEFNRLVGLHRDRIGAVVMEPIRNVWPDPGFLDAIKKVCGEIGAPLVFDEITSGLRISSGGAHPLLGVEPDIAVFAKALGNGHPMSAVIGRRAVMEAAQSTFISSTYWTERVGPAAALATLRKHRERDVPAHLKLIGEAVQTGWTEIAADVGLGVHVGGIPALSHLSFDGDEGRLLKTLFTRLMLQKGYLSSGGFYPTLAHTMDDVASYLDVVRSVFAELAALDSEQEIASRLAGPVAHAGFRRLT